jgi:hypothetical protein
MFILQKLSRIGEVLRLLLTYPKLEVQRPKGVIPLVPPSLVHSQRRLLQQLWYELEKPKANY